MARDQHYHQAIALVVAETFEQARAAARLTRVDYVRAPGAFDLAALKDTAVRPERLSSGTVPETAVGDFAGAFAAAPVQLDATYTTSDEAHTMMEPHASLAAWEGERLTVWTANQMITGRPTTWPGPSRTRRWSSSTRPTRCRRP